MQVFQEHAADGRLDVARYVVESRTSLASAIGTLKRSLMVYVIVAQLSAIISLPGPLQQIAVLVVPARVSRLLSEFWQKDPKCIVFAVLMLCLLLYRSYPVKSQTESFLVMRSLGVQTTSRGTSRFIPTEEIEDIIIHEGFKGFEVRFYLAVLLKTPGPEQREVVFPDTLPRRRTLETVWRGARQILFEDKL